MHATDNPPPVVNFVLLSSFVAHKNIPQHLYPHANRSYYFIIASSTLEEVSVTPLVYMSRPGCRLRRFLWLLKLLIDRRSRLNNITAGPVRCMLKPSSFTTHFLHNELFIGFVIDFSVCLLVYPFISSSAFIAHEDATFIRTCTTNNSQ